MIHELLLKIPLVCSVPKAFSPPASLHPHLLRLQPRQLRREQRPVLGVVVLALPRAVAVLAPPAHAIAHRRPLVRQVPRHAVHAKLLRGRGTQRLVKRSLGCRRLVVTQQRRQRRGRTSQVRRRQVEHDNGAKGDPRAKRRMHAQEHGVAKVADAGDVRGAVHVDQPRGRHVGRPKAVVRHRRLSAGCCGGRGGKAVDSAANGLRCKGVDGVGEGIRVLLRLEPAQERRPHGARVADEDRQRVARPPKVGQRREREGRLLARGVPLAGRLQVGRRVGREPELADVVVVPAGSQRRDD
mmetsp:Transcript_19812/g.63142  ORF Transcript_19812/g.63142 Transcript_19812/m.63142 type:complete len:297 (+) Transcript_19812:71-961(+)